jgi:hypothetical protein
MKGKGMVIRLFTALIILLLSAYEMYAQQKKEVKFSAQEPALITSAGQSADTQMVKVLADRIKMNIQFDPLAGPEKIPGVKSVIIVIGGSTKGMGAAGIDMDKEASRIQKFLAKVKELKIPVIGMHIGGKGRRGDLSDPFINLVAPQASYLIVVKEGDVDGIFLKTAAKNNIPIVFVNKISETQEPLKSIYGK